MEHQRNGDRHVIEEATRVQALINKLAIRELPQMDEKRGQLSCDRQWVLDSTAKRKIAFTGQAQ